MLPSGARRVLAYVAHTDAATRREIAGQLWPDVPAARAAGDLRTALWHLHRADSRLVQASAELVTLGTGVHTDLRVVEAWIAEALRVPSTGEGPPPPPAPAGAERELLPDWDDEWVAPARDRLRMLQVQAYEAVAACLLARGRVGEALAHVLPVLQAAPLRESAHELVISIHVRQGNVAEAMRHFERYRATLRAELGIEPGARLAELLAPLTALPVTSPRRHRDGPVTMRGHCGGDRETPAGAQ
jgi:DNA-binding SARP family transcriptional activator